MRIHSNDPNMKKIIFSELSYKLTGLCFKTQRELGRFCRERQYSNRFEELLKESDIPYQREFQIKNFNALSPKGNKVDFLIDYKIILDVKAKRFITKEDYIQMQRYLQSADLELGLIVNFRNSYLKPKRVLNSSYSGYLDVHSSHSDRSSDNLHLSKGYVTLITVLVIGVIGVAISISLLLLGLGSSRTSFALEQSNQAKALTNACTEEALQQIRDSTPFEGTRNLTLDQGTCTYTVTKLAGQNRTITATGTAGTIVRKASITLDKITPSINITSWQEVVDY